MTSRRLHAALACLAVTILTAATLSATGKGQPGPRAAGPQVGAPPIEVTPQEERDRREEEDRFRRFRYRPIIRVAQDYTLSADDRISELQVFFGDVTIAGHVQRNVVVIMGSARLASTGVVDGSLLVIGGSATAETGAAVHQDLVVIGGTMTAPPEFSPDAEHVVVGTPWLGEALHDSLPWVTRGLAWGRLIVPGIGWIWGVVGMFFLIYLALNTVFDRPVGKAADVMVARPVSAFMAGLLVLVLTVPALAIIAASVIGLAVIPFILCALVIVALVGKAAVARAMGRSVLRSESPDDRFPALASFVIGFALLTFAYMIPVLGFVTWALTSVLGLGAAAVTFRGYLRRERQVPAPVVAQPANTDPVVPAALAPEVPFDVVPPHVSAAEPLPPVDVPLPSPRFTAGLAAYPRATLLDRAAAFALDCILVAIAAGLLDLTRHDGYFFVLLLIYHVAFWTWKGTTLGGIICNLRVVGTHGGPLRPVDAVVRGLTSIFSIAALGIGCLWMLQDPERQTWHDKIAGTLVVKVPREVVLA